MKKQLFLLALLVLCIFTTAAVADSLNNDYYAHHLTATIPTTNGPETVRLNEKTTTVVTEEGVTTLTANVFAAVPNHVDALVNIHLVKNAEGAWVLAATPLTATFAADGLPVSTARQAAPSAEELAQLITAAGLCGHKETAVDLADCAYVAVHATSAVVTLDAEKIAVKLAETHGGDHVVGQLAQAVVTYTVDDALAPTHVKVAFDIECPETIFKVIYKDGVDGKVFRSRIISVKNGAETPAFPMENDPSRKGYEFLGWSPEQPDFVLGDAIYEAQWAPIVYNITYVNVPAGAENPNPTTYTIEDDIVFTELDADGFICWTPDGIPEGSTGDVEVVATVIPKPTLPKMGTNVAPDMMLFQCTEHAEHSWSTSTCFSANTNRTYWNAGNKRWETFVYAKAVNINLAQVPVNYFGSYNHHYASDAQSIKYYLYFEPDAEGSTSLGAPVTGLWYAVDGNPIVIDVWCYDTPTPLTADTMPSIGNALWARDCTNTKNYNRYNNVKNDVISISEMTKDDAGNYWMTVTVSGDAAVAAFQAKYGDAYTPCDGEIDNHVSAAAGHTPYVGTYDFVFKYAKLTGKTMDYSKNNWKFDSAATIALGKGYNKLNGYYIWMSAPESTDASTGNGGNGSTVTPGGGSITTPTNPGTGTQPTVPGIGTNPVSPVKPNPGSSF